MIESKNKSKTISAFFYFREPKSIGNVVIIHTLTFIENHFDVIIYTNQSELLRSQLPEARIISLDHIRLRRVPIFGMLLYYRKIAKILNSDESKIIFTGHDSAPINLWLKKTCFLYIFQVHEILGFAMENKSVFRNIYQKILRHIIIKSIRLSLVNFVVSESIIKYLRKYNIDNLYLTPHCVDLYKFSKPNFSEFHNELFRKKKQGYFIVCYTGWVSNERGLYSMLESIYLSVLKDPNILFVIAGSDVKHTLEINKFFLERNIKENLECLGKIEYDYIPGVIALSDVCLSILDNNMVYNMSPPQKVIEYLASGKPVIANNIQTHVQLITNEYNGFIIEDNPIAISSKILFLKANSKIHQQMCKNALKTAKKYDTKQVYCQMKEVINNILSQN